MTRTSLERSNVSAFTDHELPQPASRERIQKLINVYTAPLNNHAQYKIEALPADYWNPELYFGEPTYESDRAWNALIYRLFDTSHPIISPMLVLIIIRNSEFRVHRDEAVRLNITDSILVQPGEDFGTMLGALHNLHCLRRIRQMLYPDYYYPDASPEETEHNRVHAFHCLESIRTSVQCYLDLNPHPYFRSKNKYHPVTVSSKVTRQCTDWQALQQILESRNFQSEKLMANTGPMNQVMEEGSRLIVYRKYLSLRHHRF
ncbi:Tat pathway signal sequence protein [Rutstroemia sp. NJR-2017a WRK4]|nr:Tat pathway signal sequence protein [Rutstroemia sp. NJR-2017a WRK4]